MSEFEPVIKTHFISPKQTDYILSKIDQDGIFINFVGFRGKAHLHCDYESDSIFEYIKRLNRIVDVIFTYLYAAEPERVAFKQFLTTDPLITSYVSIATHPQSPVFRVGSCKHIYSFYADRLDFNNALAGILKFIQCHVNELNRLIEQMESAK